MLGSLRKSASTWVVRVFLFLLCLSFGVWGIGDIIRGHHDTSVAHVGSVTIEAQDFSQQYRTTLSALEDRLGHAVSPDQAERYGLPEHVLDQMVGRALLDQEAAHLNVSIPDEAVALDIKQNPAFHDPKGNFDRALFQQRLADQGMSEAMFAAITRGNMIREQVIDALARGAHAVPAIEVQTLYDYRQEKRVARILVIPPAKAGKVAPPTTAELAAFHKSHAAEFTAPEYRDIVFLDLTPQARAATMKVSEQELKDEYEAERGSFVVPAKRHIEQLLVPTEAAAKAAAAKIKAGATLDAVAKSIGPTAKVIDLGLQTEPQLPAALGKIAFALKKGEVSPPIQTPLGWHLLQVSEIDPGTIKTLDEVKDQIRKVVALRKAGDAMYQLSNKLQDTLAGGATLAEAAKQLGLTLHKVPAVDAKGLDPDGRKVAGLPAFSNFLSNVFSTPAGSDPEVTDAGNNAYFAVKVVGVTPPALKPLDKVKAQVEADWHAEQQRVNARKLAAVMAGRLKEGSTFESQAKDIDQKLQTLGPMTRDGNGAGAPLSPALLHDLFAARTGAVIIAPAATADEGTVVAELLQVIPADAKDNKGAVSILTSELAGAAENDLFGEYRKALAKHYGVSINHQMMQNSL